VTKLIIPSYKKFLPLLHSFVAVSIEVFEISEILEKVELCTEEAFVYLLNNSYQDEAGEIEISISIDETDFILSFLDRGLPIDIILPDTFTAVDGPESIETEKLELLLINRFSDRTEWLNHGKQGGDHVQTGYCPSFLTEGE